MAETKYNIWCAEYDTTGHTVTRMIRDSLGTEDVREYFEFADHIVNIMKVGSITMIGETHLLVDSYKED